MGLINEIIANGWEDKEFIRTRVSGYEEMAEVAKHYTPEVVEDITGIPVEQTKRVAKILALNRPTSSDLVYGRNPAFNRILHYPGLLYPAAGSRQHG